MTWPYLVIFDADLGTNKQVQDLLDELPHVTYWYRCMPNCIFFTSTMTAGTIAEGFYSKFGKGPARFMVVEVHSDRQGWLPKPAWHMFRNPEKPRLDDE